MSSSIVARIAYLSSDVLITNPSSSYTLPSGSSSSPSVEVLPAHADPSVFALRHSTSKLTSFLLANSTPSPFARLVPSLSTLAHTATVVHVALPPSSDLSDVIALRSAGWVILLSSTSQDTHDHAVIASKLARQTNRAVLHVFVDNSTTSPEFEQVDEDKLKAFLDEPLRLPETNGNGNGHSHHPRPELFKSYELASLSTLALLRRPQRPYVYTGPSSPTTVFVVFGTEASPLVELASSSSTFGVLEILILRPLAPFRLLTAIPEGVKNVVVLEQAFKKTTKWGGVYLDVVSAVQQTEDESERPKVFGGLLGHSLSSSLSHEVSTIISRLGSSQPLVLGTVPTPASAATSAPVPQVPELESAYTKMLSSVFTNQLEISNSPSLVSTSGPSATLPEFAFGKAQSDIAQRK